MTAETTGAVPWPDSGSRGGSRAVRPVTGVLADGTPYYAPIGEVVSDGTTVTCHLCGRSLKSVPAHLRVHGWTKAAYCEAFGLKRGQSLEGDQTSKRRAASFAPRLIFDPAIRAGSAAGRRRPADGVLARDAARASTGRPLPAQRRRKAARAAAASSAVAARADPDRARGQAARGRRTRQPGGRGARGDSVPRYVAERRAAGWTWRAIAAGCGQPGSWLRRQAARPSASS
jgi:ROS/MUCR transcriptional regulator protein